MGKESNTIARTIREAIFIRVNDPSLNRKTGKNQLPTYGMRSCFTSQAYTSNWLLPDQPGSLDKVHNTISSIAGPDTGHIINLWKVWSPATPPFVSILFMRKVKEYFLLTVEYLSMFCVNIHTNNLDALLSILNLVTDMFYFWLIWLTHSHMHIQLPFVIMNFWFVMISFDLKCLLLVFHTKSDLFCVTLVCNTLCCFVIPCFHL